METNYELKEINIKNCSCHYFDDIIEFEDFDLGNMLTDENSNENISFRDILYKTLIGAKILCFRFDKINGFIM